MAMAPHAPQPVPDNGPPRFYPVQFHSEFGYLAPTLHFRSKVSLLGKGTAFGLIVGIIVAIVVSPDRQVRLQSALSMQSQAATTDLAATAPIRFVAATLAMRDAQSTGQAKVVPAPVAHVPPSAVTPAAAPPVPPPAVALAVTPEPVVSAPRPQIVTPKAKKKVTRQPRHERNDARVDRRNERDPRSAYAAPSPRKPEPQAEADGRRRFGVGW